MKKIKILGLIIALVLLVTGCSSPAFEAYSEANNRTLSAQRGKESLDLKFSVEINKEGLSQEVIDKLRFFESFGLKYRRDFDKDIRREMVSFHSDIYGMGIQGKYYMDGETSIMVLPMMPKMLVLSSRDMEDIVGEGVLNNQKQFKINPATMDAIKTIWGQLINKDNVATIGNIIVSTPEGEIKTKEFNLRFSEGDIKPVIKEVANIALKDKDLMETLDGFIKTEGYNGVKVSDLERDLMDLIDRLHINLYNQKAFIDKDNYLVEELINVELEAKDPQPGEAKKIVISIRIQNWDINRPVDIYIPEVTKDNSMLLDSNLNIEDIFPKNQR